MTFSNLKLRVNDNAHDKLLQMLDGSKIHEELLAQMIVEECIRLRHIGGHLSPIDTIHCMFESGNHAALTIKHLTNMLASNNIGHVLSGNSTLNHLWCITFTLNHVTYAADFWNKANDMQKYSFIATNRKLTLN